MSFNIEQFKSDGLNLGGARPSLFEIMIPGGWPGSLNGADVKLTFLAKAASLPPSMIDPIEIPYFGRRIKIAGDRSFPPWSITVMNDEDFIVRDSFEEWHALMNSRVPNLMQFSTSAPQNYKRDIIVKQYSKTGSGTDLGAGVAVEGDYAEKYAYTLVGAFPTVVDPIQLDWEAINQIEQFNVEFAYDYWEPYVIDSGSGQASSTRLVNG